ncbi:MAG: ubiquinol-cytochrome c reductase iron-sulfur subunit [Dehalococcoidia bacterium]|nr:ubiquinol-cytochrome c reductase iron-sulfur subunit [Dehalococcoidia bacterium]
MKDTNASKAISRRSFLDYGIRAIGAFITAAVAVPVVGYVISPVFAKRESPWVQVGAVSDFKVGEPKSVDFNLFRKDGWIEVSEKKTVWVVRQADQTFNLFNPRCTHLGCAYNWDPQGKQFGCPCHGAVFDLSGKVIAGPPPRPLDTLEYKVEGSQLSCIFKDFLLGVQDKIAS